MKTFSRLLIGLIFSAILISCSGDPASLEAVPKDAVVVAKLDVFSIARKGRLDQLEDYRFFRTMKKEMRQGTKEMARMMDGFQEDPTKLGIDFFAPVYGFYVNDGDDQQYVCLAGELSNAENFASSVEEFFETVGADFDIEKKKSFSWMKTDGEVTIAWDDSKFVIVNATNYSSRENSEFQAETLMTLGKGRQILSDERFQAFYKESKDLSVWGSTDFLEKQREFKKIQRETNFDFSDSRVIAHLNFEDDLIRLQVKTDLNKELSGMYAENNMFAASFDDALLKSVPEGSLAGASMAMDLKAAYNLMEQQGPPEVVEKMEASLKERMDLDLEEIMDSFGGSAVFTLSDIRKETYTVKRYDYYQGYYDAEQESMTPIMSFAMDLNGSEVVEKFIGNIPEDDIQKRNGYAQVSIGRQAPWYAAYDDKALLITNELEAAKAFEGRSLDADFPSSVTSQMTGNPFYGYLNLNWNDYPAELRKETTQSMRSNQAEQLESFNKFATRFEYIQKKDGSVELILHTDKEKDNSLQALMSMLDSSASLFM